MLMRVITGLVSPEGEMVEEMVLCDVETGLPATDEQMQKELKEPEPKAIYIGKSMILVGFQGENGKIMQRPQEIKFMIPASSRKEAFEKFTQAGEAEVARIKEAQEAHFREMQKESQKKLIVPNSAQAEVINNLKLST